MSKMWLVHQSSIGCIFQCTISLQMFYTGYNVFTYPNDTTGIVTLNHSSLIQIIVYILGLKLTLSITFGKRLLLD